MSGVIKNGENQEALQWLRTGQPPEKVKDRTILNLAAQLLEVFGQRYAPQICTKLGNKVGAAYDQLHRAYCEIQKKLTQREKDYVELQFPKTRQIVERYRKETQSDPEFFDVLQQRSYEILPLPQKILTYPEPDLKSLARIDAIRDKAFTLMSGRLARTFVEEAKGVEPPPPVKKREWTPEEEMAVNKLYYSGVAFVYGGKSIYFSELIDMWQHVAKGNEQLRAQFLEKLSLSHWVKEAPKPQVNFLKFCEPSFNRFLNLCSIDIVQKNLDIEFSSSLEQTFMKMFQDELIRSDFCYFTADLRGFYEMDLEKLQRPSAPHLRSLQLFIFIVRTYGVRREDQVSLLNMILHRERTANPEVFEGFRQRCWDYIMPENQTPEFSKAWNGLKDVLCSISRSDVSFSNPTIKDEALFQDSHCWPLFVFLLHHQRSHLFIELFCALAKEPRINMSLAILDRFCVANEHELKDLLGKLLVEKYFEIQKMLQQNGIEAENLECLFLDPPIEHLQNKSLKIGDSLRAAARFIECMKPYRFPPDKRFVRLLRHQILHPSRMIFDLLRDIPELGIKEPSEELLWDAISVTHAPLAPDMRELPKPDRERALGIASKLQERYRFSESQSFFLYLEIIRLVLAGKEEVIGKISDVIHELEPFCPALEKKDIYFLFLYHPEMTPEQVVSLQRLRDDWAKSDHQLNRFIIDQEEFSAILGPIEEFVVPLSRACNDEDVSSRFVNTFRQSILSAFFPPLQPLTDYFRITNLTAKDGVRWGEPVWSTHLGQLKYILGKASVGIYFNWAIYNDQPVLFLSFPNIRNGTAFSAFIPLKVSAAELEPDQRRRPFYSLLSEFSRQVLREEAEENPPKAAPETPESWIPCFIGLKEQIATYEEDIKAGNLKPQHINEMWKFFLEVKVAYRNLFLCSVADRRPPPFPSYDPIKVAGVGHIFSSHPRGSLLPSSLLEIEAHPKAYLPDANEDFLQACFDRGIFLKPNGRSELLNLMLTVAGGKEFLISYLVQTADEVSGMELDKVAHWNEAAPKKEQVQGKYVTLSIDGGKIKVPLKYPPEALTNPQLFQRYFDYHNLVLKAIIYYHLSSQVAVEE